VPSVSFSPCGEYIASTSIDNTVKVWKQNHSQWDLYGSAKPDKDFGWAIRWANKSHCLPIIEFEFQKKEVNEIS
jgi:WD40 repeat protein